MGKDVEVNLENIKFDITSDSSITHDGTVNADVNSQSSITVDTGNMRTKLELPQPFRTESSFTIPEPIVLDNTSNIGLDIRPLVMDFCFKFEIGKLPPVCIRRPYQHHFGITLFGMEVLGFNLAGESRIQIDEVQKRPQVDWGGAEPARSEPKRGGHGRHQGGRSQRGEGSDGGGLRIRLD